MQICVWITGPTGSGKTTLARQLSSRGWQTVHTGDLFRDCGLAAGETDTESVVAPESADGFLRHSIINVLQKAARPDVPVTLVAIECWPRRADQVEFCLEAESLGYTNIIIYLDADSKLRMDRYKSRDFADKVRMDRDNKKFCEEKPDEMWHGILQAALLHGIVIQKMSTDDLTVPPAKPMTLESMRIAAHNLSVEKRLQGLKPVGVGDVSNLLQLAELELIEARVAHEVKNDKAHVLEELADTLWFMLVAVTELGYTADDLAEKFAQKAAINGYRMDTGTKPSTKA